MIQGERKIYRGGREREREIEREKVREREREKEVRKRNSIYKFGRKGWGLCL